MNDELREDLATGPMGWELRGGQYIRDRKGDRFIYMDVKDWDPINKNNQLIMLIERMKQQGFDFYVDDDVVWFLDMEAGATGKFCHEGYNKLPNAICVAAMRSWEDRIRAALKKKRRTLEEVAIEEFNETFSVNESFKNMFVRAARLGAEWQKEQCTQGHKGG